jgi:hypothetical protein
MHQLSAEEVVKLNSRCAALSELADQVLATRHSMCMIDVYHDRRENFVPEKYRYKDRS